MLQQLLISQNEMKQYVGHMNTRIDQTDEPVAKLERAHKANDLETKDNICSLNENILEQGRAQVVFKQKLTERLDRLETAQRRAAELAAQAQLTASAAQATATRAATTATSRSTARTGIRATWTT